MLKKENPAGGPGMGMDLVTRCVSRVQCFTAWAGCQAELLVLAVVLAVGSI